jgi:hypothetical protein
MKMAPMSLEPRTERQSTFSYLSTQLRKSQQKSKLIEATEARNEFLHEKECELLDSEGITLPKRQETSQTTCVSLIFQIYVEKRLVPKVHLQPRSN